MKIRMCGKWTRNIITAIALTVGFETAHGGDVIYTTVAMAPTNATLGRAPSGQLAVGQDGTHYCAMSTGLR